MARHDCALARWLDDLYVDEVHDIIYESRWFYDLPQDVRDAYLRMPLTAYYEDVSNNPVRIFAIGRQVDGGDIGCYAYALRDGTLSAMFVPEISLSRIREWNAETVKTLMTSLPHPEIMLNKCGPMAVVAMIHYNNQLKRKSR
jgi:hypothetical protein